MEDQEDQPIRQMLKVITVCRCVAGYADRPETGDPIAILTIEHLGETEGFLLTIPEVRRLLRGLANVLCFHANEQETGNITPEAEVRTASIKCADKMEFPQDCAQPRSDTASLPKTGIKMRMKSPEMRSPKMYDVFGGYYSGREKFVMYRFYSDTSPRGRCHPCDSVVRIGPKDTYVVGCLGPEQYLPIEDWGRFKELASGATFRLGTSLWKKMSKAQLCRILHGKVFTRSF